MRCRRGASRSGFEGWVKWEKLVGFDADAGRAVEGAIAPNAAAGQGKARREAYPLTGEKFLSTLVAVRHLARRMGRMLEYFLLCCFRDAAAMYCVRWFESIISENDRSAAETRSEPCKEPSTQA